LSWGRGVFDAAFLPLGLATGISEKTAASKPPLPSQRGEVR
jgi:hypothetical protein